VPATLFPVGPTIFPATVRPPPGIAPPPPAQTAGPDPIAGLAVAVLPDPAVGVSVGAAPAAAAAAGQNCPTICYASTALGWYRSGCFEIWTACASTPTGLVCQFAILTSRSRKALVAFTGSSATCLV